MSFDYYVFQKANLISYMCDLEEAAEARKRAKKENDKRKQTENEKKIKRAATEIVRIEPHLSSLWYEALKNDLKDRIRGVWQKDLTVLPEPWQEGNVEFNRLPDNFDFVPGTNVLSYLPNFSFMLEIPFILSKPFYSKDERDFYLLDNPLRREKVFKTPMIAASSWKGALRSAMVKQLAEWWESLKGEEKKERFNNKRFVAWRCQLSRIFGTEQGIRLDDDSCETYLDKIGGDYQKRWFRRFIQLFVAKNGFFAGCLHFFPTYFDKVKLEVINPHDRIKGISKRGPLLFECVSNGARGRLVLLYVIPGLTTSVDKKRETVAQDLKLLAEGIVGMLTVYGFGAKTSSGFGTAEERLAGGGKVVIKIPCFSKTPASPMVQPQHQDLPRYQEANNRLINELRCPDGSLKSKEGYRQYLVNKGRKYSKQNQQLYVKDKAWWEKEGKKLLTEKASQMEDAKHSPAGEGKFPSSEYFEKPFRTLKDFYHQTEETADFLMGRGSK